MDYSYIDKNVEDALQLIEEARKKAGIKEKVTMVAAVKYADINEINHLCSIGVRDIGENRVQQLLEH